MTNFLPAATVDSVAAAIIADLYSTDLADLDAMIAGVGGYLPLALTLISEARIELPGRFRGDAALVLGDDSLVPMIEYAIRSLAEGE